MTYVLVNPQLSENTHFKNGQCVFLKCGVTMSLELKKYTRVLTLNEYFIQSFICNSSDKFA